MKYSKGILIVLYIFFCKELVSQETKFGAVSKEELTQTSYPADPTASAAVLYREKNIYYQYIQSVGFKLVTYVYERLKIYRKDGFKYATVKENLYKNGGDIENISGLKAFTYNWENGSIVKQKLDRSGEFTTELNKYSIEEKFTMPNVKEGSVIEYAYRLESPFYGTIKELQLQYDIPIQDEDITIEIPEYFVFKTMVKGYLPVKPIYSSSIEKIDFVNKVNSDGRSHKTYSTSSMNYRINKTSFHMKLVPALKEEPFVNHMDNYRSSISYELQYVQFPQTARTDYATTWEKVVENIYKSKGFGDQLDNSKYFRDELASAIEGSTDDASKMSSIFHYVQQRMTWDKFLGYSSEKGVKDSYTEKSGNTADINLMLIAMLRKAGLEAHPVILSTRDNGVPLFPTMNGFNYVVAAVTINGVQTLLDATNKYTEPDILPMNALNWQGKLIKEDGSFSTLSVIPEKQSRENVVSNLRIDAAGEVSGKLRKIGTDYYAFRFRNNFGDVSRETYLEKLESKNTGMEIISYTLQNEKTLGRPIIEEYEFKLEDQVNRIGDKMYFSPLFHTARTENPFKLEQRNYPIDFVHPWEEKYVFNIAIPEGYEVLSIPENLNIVLPNNVGGFVYQTIYKGQMLQILVSIKMNQAIIPAAAYAELKEFYKIVVEKEAEKVVLTKIASNGNQDSATGGR
jgi:hypothetical protein